MAEFDETVLDHVSGDNWWGVSTGEEALRNKLFRLAEQYPDEVQVIARNDDGSAYFHIGYKWVHIFRPRVLSEATLRANKIKVEKMLEINRKSKHALADK